MKKYSLIILTLLFVANTKSQEYKNLIKSGNKWNILYEWFATCNCGGSETYSLTLSNDTLIENQIYKKLMCKLTSADNYGAVTENIYCAAALREDIEKQIVYVRYPNNEEQILFSFNVNTGDTILIKDVYKDTWTDSKTVRTVKNVGQYNFSGLTGKMITVCDTLYEIQRGYDYGKPVTYYHIYEVYRDVWYEGIGSMKSLIELGQRGIDVLQLICFWNNDDIIYHQSEHSECLYASYWNELKNVSEEKEFIMPNLTNGKLSIRDGIQVTLIQIFNTKGIKLVETKDKNIDLSNLANGLYFVKISTESGILNVEKVIKQN